MTSKDLIDRNLLIQFCDINGNVSYENIKKLVRVDAIERPLLEQAILEVGVEYRKLHHDDEHPEEKAMGIAFMKALSIFERYTRKEQANG